MKRPKYDNLIIFGSILGMISFSNLIYKLYETQDAAVFSWFWIIANITSQVSYLIFGYVNNSIGIGITSIFFIPGLLYILYVKINTIHKENNINK